MVIFSKKLLGIRRIRVGSKKKKFGEYLFRQSKDLDVYTKLRFFTEIWSQPTFFSTKMVLQN